MREVSEAMVREVFAEDGRLPATLVTFESSDLPEPIRATDHPEGIVSRGETFRFFPFTFSAGGASAEDPDRTMRLEIANLDALIAEAIRSTAGQPICTVELVRVLDPNAVEIAFRDCEVRDVEVTGPTVIFQLAGRELSNQFACSKRYVQARTPALF